QDISIIKSQKLSDIDAPTINPNELSEPSNFMKDDVRALTSLQNILENLSVKYPITNAQILSGKTHRRVGEEGPPVNF
ncbi:9577_t:CDS:2, partial [Cetraspora pellucida]